MTAQTQPSAVEALRKALRRAFVLGENHAYQSDSDSSSQNRKADVTLATFRAHVEETVAALAASQEAPKALGDSHPFAALGDLMRADPEYAWAVHCNVAMPIMDRLRCTHREANEAGADVVSHLFNVDVRANQNWAYAAAPTPPASQSAKGDAALAGDAVRRIVFNAFDDLEAGKDRGTVQVELLAALANQGNTMNTTIANEIAAERIRQDAQWGGPEHDDQHTPQDFLRYIGKQVHKGQQAQFAGEREALVKIAALAVAALESMNRTAAPAAAPARAGREAEWITKLREEARHSAMKDVFSLSRDEVFELIGMFPPTHPREPVAGDAVDAEPDYHLAVHWIDRYAAGLDEQVDMVAVCDALGVKWPEDWPSIERDEGLAKTIDRIGFGLIRLADNDLPLGYANTKEWASEMLERLRSPTVEADEDARTKDTHP